MDQAKTEELLHQIQAVVNNSYDAIISATLEGIITSWNGGAQRMFGYSAEEVIGKSGESLFPPEMWAKIPALLEKIKVKEPVGDYDISGLRKDGTNFNMAISISPILKEDGTVIGASIVERDITARSKAWELVRQFEILVQNSHDAIIGETLDGTITSWNGGAEKMFGYSAEEVVGKSVLLLFPPEMKDILPLLMGKIGAGEFVVDRDSVRLRKDGTKIDVSITLSPVFDMDGKVISASVVERDITERKKMVEAMRQIQSGVNNSQDGIISSSLDGIVLSWNKGAQAMLGYSAEEILGKSSLILFPPEKEDEFKIYSDKIKKNESITNYDSLALRKDGSRVDISISISPILSENGSVAGASVFFRDIAERKKTSLHIEELNEVRSKFIEIISHQLRTPLTAVNWNLEMLLGNNFGKLEETQHKFLQATYASSVEITRRIHNLLAAMDVEEGRARFVSEEVILNSLCAGTVNEMQKRAGLKNISLSYIPPQIDIPAIHGDGEKIRMAISALVENAISYTNEDGKIIAKLGEEDGVARFEISDNGVGIPQEEQHLIFNRFYRASNASVMLPDAFGLGLFTAKSYIEQHHGKLGFESKEGVGSTFWFELPIAK